MTAGERGFLLLCCALGDREARPLTTAQLRELSRRAASAGIGGRDPFAELRPRDLTELGYDADQAERIAALLGRERRLERYLERARSLGIVPLTRLSPGYPARLNARRGLDRPPIFFCAGNLSLLGRPCVGLAGSRRLEPPGAAFASRAGELAAREGLTLVTGGAGGADAAALEACLANGGSAVLFVPDALERRLSTASERCLVCSEGGYELPFSAARAAARNAVIHMMGEKTLIAQVRAGGGGTWRGALENLRRGWSELYVHDDGSPGAQALAARGATPVEQLASISGLRPTPAGLFAPVERES